ncbi:unnamed protein product [Bemisia tabaci]|uniref:BRCA1-associated protein n=1 Tax=Bemisia tabaci TaxID=7038 RepID=A0A9P0AIH8_BEMTA|nr:unnamed protein product [Bemisia tabaci]
MSVALCVFRFEICDLSEDSEELSGAMALQDSKLRAMRGRRKPQQITVESYQAEDEPTKALLGDSARPTTSFDDSQSSKPQISKAEKCGGKDDQISFVSGNPFVEVTKGILHLYKEDKLTSMENASKAGQTVCILAVPASMTCHDLLSFIAACQDTISCVRIVRDGSVVNQYMTLITFRTQQAAEEFYQLFNGVPFNSLEPDFVCNLVFVRRVEVLGENNNGAIPPSGHTELPICPVCLERMDESVDGILTILCNHSFHGTCIAKWGDISCPVCRYVQTPELVTDSFCSECQSADSLWICLICGHVGCGRYTQGHAYQHYVETQHCYSMHLGNNRVWDYVGDNFVHRILMNKGDGKLVEGESEKSEAVEDKMDSVQLEFTYLLTSQLDSQRQYFEDKLSRLESQRLCELSDLKDTTRKAVEEKRKLEQKLSTLVKEKQTNDKKLHQISTRLSQTQSELSDERQLSQALQENQTAWQSRFNNLEKEFKDFKSSRDEEMKELKEQIRDLMFTLEAQNFIANSDNRDEIAEGRIVVGSSNAADKPATSQRRRKKR